MKNEKLLEAVKLINKKFAKNKEDRASQIDLEVKSVPKITSGSIAIDAASNAGGIPEGRIYEFYGKESSGKTTIALMIAKEYLKNNKNVVYIDAEQAFDPDWARKIGVDVNNEHFILIQEYIMENVFEIIHTMIKDGDVKLIIVDSAAALSPKDDMEIGNALNGGMPAGPKILTRQLRLLVPVASQNNCNVIFINHEKEEIGKFGFGSKDTTPGGKALKFYSSMRLRVMRVGTEKENDIKSANKVKICFVKNKVGKPFGESELILNFDKGFDEIREIIDFGLKFNIIQKDGTKKYSYNGNVIANSFNELKKYIEENVEMIKQVKEKIYENLKNNILLNYNQEEEEDIEENE